MVSSKAVYRLIMAIGLFLVTCATLNPLVSKAFADNSNSRSQFAQHLNEAMEGDGMRVYATGKGNTALRMERKGMSKAFADTLVAIKGESAKEMGFKKMVFYNGSTVWEYDLRK